MLMLVLISYFIGDLQRQIKLAKAENRRLEEPQILYWFAQLCLAVKHIHTHKILHRDIKCQNVLMTMQGMIKLSDFGVSRTLERTGDLAKTSLGTPYYLSPEICMGQKYDYKTDIWMLGCLLYELCALHKPFEGESLHSVMNKILNQECDPLPEYYSEDLKSLVKIMLEKNSNVRASIDDLLAAPKISIILTEIQKREEYIGTIIIVPSLQNKQMDENSNIEESKNVPETTDYATMEQQCDIIDNDEVKMEDNNETSPSKKLAELKKNCLTINTCFESNGSGNNSEAAKAASTKSHLRQKKPPPKRSVRTSDNKKSIPKHFVFSEYLLNPQASFSPNRPLLFTEFLIKKLGKDVFDAACNLLKDSTDPLVLLEQNPDQILSIIGEKNLQFLQVFKYIISANLSACIHSQLTSQQLQLLQQCHSRTKSMQTPVSFIGKTPNLMNLQQDRPYSTRSQEMATLKPRFVHTDKSSKDVSPISSAATDTTIETPKYV